jgi:Uma2 family endonuclease
MYKLHRIRAVWECFCCVVGLGVLAFNHGITTFVSKYDPFMKNDLAFELFRPLNPIDLIGANGFYTVPQSQLICFYEPWDRFVISTISPDSDYTIAHYELLPESAPFQLLQGKLCFMPTPNIRHQRISGNIVRELYGYVVAHKLGEVFYVLDVEFNENTIAQPDILFISNQRKDIAKNDALRVVGAPDFIVEILLLYEFDDRVRKMQIYEESDVLEYWIVVPTTETVEVYQNMDSKMVLTQTAQRGEVLHSVAIEGFSVEVDRVFG